MSVDPPTALSMDDLAAALRFFFGIFDVIRGIGQSCEHHYVMVTQRSGPLFTGTPSVLSLVYPAQQRPKSLLRPYDHVMMACT